MNRVARLITFVFNPLLMPTFGILILFNSGSLIDFTSLEVKRAVYMTTVVGTFALPISMVPLWTYKKFINSIMMEDMQERVVPFIATSIFYFFAYLVCTRIPVSPIVKDFLLSTSVSVFLVSLINFRWKISAHTTGIGGIVGLLVILTFRLDVEVIEYLIAGIALAGLISFARLKLNSHTPSQVYAGFLLGLAVVSVTLN